MNILITGSETLSDLDKKDIKKYLKMYAPKHTIHLMCYKSLEKEVLKFFIEEDGLAPSLKTYSFQTEEALEESVKDSLNFLKNKGAIHKSFGFEEQEVYRSDYVETFKEIIGTNIDLVVCFYNKDKSTALIPLDIAKELDVDAMYYELPGDKRELLKRKMEDKIRVI